MTSAWTGQSITNRAKHDRFANRFSPRNPVATAVIPLNDLAAAILSIELYAQPVSRLAPNQRQKIAGHQAGPDDIRRVV